MSIKIGQKEKGQSLLEVVFVISISALLLSGLAAATTFIIATARFNRQKTLATQLAKKQLEDIRVAKLDQSWWGNLSTLCNKCQQETNCQGYKYFTCQTCYQNCHISGTQKDVTVKVKVWWSKRGMVEMATVYSNWQ